MFCLLVVKMANIYWRDAINKKMKIIDRGASYTTKNGDLIFWHGQEALEAQRTLAKVSKKEVIHKIKDHTHSECGIKLKNIYTQGTNNNDNVTCKRCLAVMKKRYVITGMVI